MPRKTKTKERPHPFPSKGITIEKIEGYMSVNSSSHIKDLSNYFKCSVQAINYHLKKHPCLRDKYPNIPNRIYATSADEIAIHLANCYSEKKRHNIAQIAKHFNATKAHINRLIRSDKHLQELYSSINALDPIVCKQCNKEFVPKTSYKKTPLCYEKECWEAEHPRRKPKPLTKIYPPRKIPSLRKLITIRYGSAKQRINFNPAYAGKSLLPPEDFRRVLVDCPIHKEKFDKLMKEFVPQNPRIKWSEPLLPTVHRLDTRVGYELDFSTGYSNFVWITDLQHNKIISLEGKQRRFGGGFIYKRLDQIYELGEIVNPYTILEFLYKDDSSWISFMLNLKSKLPKEEEVEISG